MRPDIHPNHPRPSASKREPEPGIKLPLLLLLFLVLVIAGGGYLLFSQMQRTETLAAQQNLAAIAELKADQINQWIERNKSNAMITSRASPVADRTRMWFGKGMRGGEDLEWLHARLEALRKIYSSSEMIIADVTGKALISTEPQLPDLSDLDPLMRRAVEENRPLIGDFRWARQRRGNPYISVPIVAPLIPTGEDSKAIGVLLIMADADQFLYPLIQKWPTPSETAETLLIRRDGEEVLFLNELRHLQGTALSVRFPASNRSLLVSRAIEGERGFVSGIDYRGEPVIGFSTGIPDTNWIMVAKIDQREVYAPIRQTAVVIISSALVLLLISSLVLYLWWRQRKERNRAAQLQTELNRQLIESQYEALSKYANDIILMIDSNYTIREANDRAEDAFGYSRIELIGKSVIDLMDPVEANAFDPHRQQILQHTGFVFESRMRHRDGRVFPVEVSGRPIKAGSEVFVQNIIRDISERKRLESDLRRSEQRFKTVLANRQITVFEQDEDLRYTWYHHLEQGENPERIIGRHDADLMDEGSAAAVEAVKRSVLESGAPRRFESCIALYDGRQECFDLYAEPRHDDSGRVVGIVGMTVDITERKLEARRLERTSRLLQETQAIARVGGWELDLANRRLYWTEETYHIHDTTPEEYRPSVDTALRFYPPESVDVITQAVQDAIEHQTPFDLELPIVSAKGREVWVRTTCRVIEENGQAVRIIGAFQDITDRKRFEDELRRREQEYRRLVEGLPKTNIARFDAERRFIFASPGVGEKFSVPVDFLLGKRPTETGFDPDFAAALEERIVHVLQTGRGISFQRSYETVQGSNHREFNLIPEFVENGHVRTVLHTSYDITEMKALEDALRLERAQLRAAIDSMVDEVWFTDGAGNIILTNDSAVKNLGFDSRDTFFQNIQQALAGLEIFEQDGTPRTYERAPLVRALKGEVLKNYGELIKNNRTGELRYREVSSAPVRDAQGDIIGSVGVVRDITERKRIEDALRESEEQFRLLAESLPQLVWITRADGYHEYFNQRWYDYTGMKPEASRGEGWESLVHPEDRPRLLEAWQRSLGTGTDYSVEYRLRDRNGRYCWFLAKALPVRNDRGEITRWFGTSTDIDDLRKAQEELQLAALVYQESAEAMMVTDEHNRIVAINPAFERLTGYRANEIVGKNPLLLSSGKDNRVHYREMLDKLMKGHYWQGELWLSKKNGEVFAAGMTINTTFRPDGSVNRHVALFNDVTQRKQAEEQVWQQANYDTLTGLPNRRHFLDQLRQEIRKSRRSRQSFALMFLDLDGFKYVNDTLGHEAGDLLLKEAAQRLVKCVRETDTVARLGGDEFTILLVDQPSTRHAEKVARHILHKLSEPFQLGKEVAHVSASLGITFHPQDGASLDDLLINADQAMYAAKEAGKNRFSFFTADMQRAAQERTWFIAELRNAIDSRQFRLVYQPIVELSTGCINKVEALLRWEHPERGAIDPSIFIPIAEETGIIQDIGDWVFFEAANQVAKWRRTYHPDFQVSINKSPVQFKSKVDDLVAWFDHLKRLNLPGQSIAVEITEGVLMDESKAVTDQLIAFRDAGIEVSLDDFGTGYSTLSYLKRFDIDRLKIDQTFIRDLETDPNDQALCEAMIVMGHKLGIKVIAEGVETDRQRDILAQAGCDFVQGYLLSNPVSAEALEQLLQRGAAPCAPDAPET